MRVDLHTHSTRSDGTLSPTELVAAAAKADIQMLALTDHDTVSGIAEAQQAARQYGIRLIAGVEISVSWQGKTVHILGLNIDPECSSLKQGLARLIDYRQQRAVAIGQKLAHAGIYGAFTGAKALAKGDLVGRTHFARFLVEQGYVKDIKTVFKKYLVKGKPGYVAGQWASLEEALAWIQAAGGIAVIAHPARYPMNKKQLQRLIEQFKALGGKGIEVFSGSHRQEDNHLMLKYAQQFALWASVGSDYHGPENAWRPLGTAELPPRYARVWDHF